MTFFRLGLLLVFAGAALATRGAEAPPAPAPDIGQLIARWHATQASVQQLTTDLRRQGMRVVAQGFGLARSTEWVLIELPNPEPFRLYYVSVATRHPAGPLLEEPGLPEGARPRLVPVPEAMGVYSWRVPRREEKATFRVRPNAPPEDRAHYETVIVVFTPRRDGEPEDAPHPPGEK